MQLLSVNGLAKSFGAVKALRSASLELRAGEVHALMGENGAGKSTLIKILAGAVTPDDGEIVVDGRVAAIEGPQRAHALGLRFVHQELNVVPSLSVAENLLLGRRLPRRLGLLIDWPALYREARAALGALGIDHIDPRSTMARLPLVDRMLVRIAAAFHETEGSRGRIYVMDEPTAALSAADAEKLFAIIDRLAREGCAVLYVSHRMDEVMRISSRVTVLRDGETRAVLETATTTRSSVIEAMTGRAVSEVFPPRQASAATGLALSVRGLDDAVLRDISFDVAKGEILGVAGLEGSGQNRLLRALVAGGVRGEIRIADRVALRREPADGWRAGLGYVPRERRSEGIVANADIIANVTLPHLGRLSRSRVLLDRRREQTAVETVARRTRLKSAGLYQRLWQLSGGNQQKVVFARAIAGTPGVLVLDDPTRGVDVGAKQDIYALLRELTAAGTAVVLASSDQDELIGMADRVAVMRNGRLATIVPALGLTPQALLGMCYGEPLP